VIGRRGQNNKPTPEPTETAVSKFALPVAAAVLLGTGAGATADARPLLGYAFAGAAAGAAAAASSSLLNCDDGLCPKNGPQLTGMALPSVKAKQPIVNAVTLPSGETVELR